MHPRHDLSIECDDREIRIDDEHDQAGETRHQPPPRRPVAEEDNQDDAGGHRPDRDESKEAAVEGDRSLVKLDGRVIGEPEKQRVVSERIIRNMPAATPESKRAPVHASLSITEAMIMMATIWAEFVPRRAPPG